MVSYIRLTDKLDMNGIIVYYRLDYMTVRYIIGYIEYGLNAGIH